MAYLNDVDYGYKPEGSYKGIFTHSTKTRTGACGIKGSTDCTIFEKPWMSMLKRSEFCLICSDKKIDLISFHYSVNMFHTILYTEYNLI